MCGASVWGLWEVREQADLEGNYFASCQQTQGEFLSLPVPVSQTSTEGKAETQTHTLGSGRKWGCSPEDIPFAFLVWKETWGSCAAERVRCTPQAVLRRQRQGPPAVVAGQAAEIPGKEPFFLAGGTVVPGAREESSWLPFSLDLLTVGTCSFQNCKKWIPVV